MWLKEKDENTRYFRTCVKLKSKINNIVALKIGNGWNK